METMIYRRSQRKPSGTMTTYENIVCQDNRGLPEPLQEVLTLHPVMFYPSIAPAELTVWNHWLPTTTVFKGGNQQAQEAFFHRLEELGAPQAVVRECQWAWNMDLFEDYALKTPERRDLRDPLVLGRLETQYYRIVLWGESLRPLEEITALVQQSLALRRRTAKWMTSCMVSGAVMGLILGLWVTGQLPAAEDVLGVSLASTTMGTLFMGLPFFIYTPEHRQQRFLDRYRQ
jgi:hypothetical protein